MGVKIVGGRCRWNRMLWGTLLAGMLVLSHGQIFSEPAIDGHYSRQIHDTRGGWAKSKFCYGKPSTACMGCSLNFPRFARKERLAPVAVGTELFSDPEKGAACGMCLKVWMVPPPRDGRLVERVCFKDAYTSIPECPGRGEGSYIKSVSQPWAWRAKVYDDEDLPYFIAIAMDWAAEGIELPHGISYVTKGEDASKLGNWPLKVAVIPCPVGDFTMEYAFMTYGSESSNTWNKKLMIMGQRTVISGVDFLLEDGEWYLGTRSGDGYWMTPPGIRHDPSKPISVRIWCGLNLQPTIEPELIPNKMLCKYQDPNCKPFVGLAQC